jgi:hypothetical protein
VRTRLLLVALAAPTLALQLVAPAPRLDADAVEYYSHLRSLYYDLDLDFANEFDHFGILERGDKVQPTATGHRRTIFSVGPALLWLPFYAAGDLLARGVGDAESGYSALHVRAVTLGSLFYGLLGLWLVHRVLRSRFAAPVSFWTTILLLYGTFLYWYLVFEPVMSHAGSFFLSAAALCLWWDERDELTARRSALLGLVIGLAATVRWQNGVLLLLPASSLLPELRRRVGPTLWRGGLALGCFAVGALPQLLAWKAIFGQFLLADPPHGRDFLRLSHPFLLETFFSSRHGLLFWTPVLWGGFLGLLAVLRSKPRLGLALLAPVLVMSYVNACSGDWWAGGSFSNRRFDSLLPFLGVGLAATLSWLWQMASQRPGRVLATAAAIVMLWNFLFMELYRRPLIPRDDTVSFARVAGHNAGLLTEWVGSPVAWPANWLFALRNDLPAAQYDLLVGKYLFYRQNNLGGVIDIGASSELDAALLADGWGVRRPCGDGYRCRDVLGRARLFAPLDQPSDLRLEVRALGVGRLRVLVNGHPLGDLPLAAELQDLELRVPRERLRREQNEVTLATSPGGSAQVERLVFEQLSK